MSEDAESSVSTVNAIDEGISNGYRKILFDLVENPKFNLFIIGVIIINSIVLGIETSKSMVTQYGDILTLINKTCLIIYIIEISLKLFAYHLKFFKNGWNNFDFIKAAQFYAKSCDDGSGEGCYASYSVLLYGVGVPTDSTKAMKEIDQGCKLGHEKSCRIVGINKSIGIQ